MMFEVNARLQIPESEFEWSFVRSSGPGGQNVNKVNSKAVLRWNVSQTSSLPEPVKVRFLSHYRRKLTTEGDLLLSSQRYRDQGRNVADVLEKLREMILVVARPPKTRRATKPTKASVTRRIEAKQVRSRQKQLRRKVGDE